jgi:hypothetical protein
MRTPDELRGTLALGEDVPTALAVYKEAAGYVKAFEAVKDEALELARASMQADGVLHHKDGLGSAGWTAPKTPKLDRDKWLSLLTQDEELKRLQDEADRAAALLEVAQERAGCLVLPERRFYIK